MVAVGFAVHTGWAAAVVVDGDPQQARVIDRRRVSLWDTGDDRFVFHIAAGLSLADAATLVEEARVQAVSCATREVGALVAAHRPVRAALGKAGKPLPSSLKVILAAHSRLHAGEGALFRDALIAACLAHDVQVVIPDPASVGEVARPAGPPWAKEQQACARLAWAAIVSEG